MKILINASNSEETRVAVLDQGRLVDLEIEHIENEQKKANIYKARIARFEQSLNAVFVDYGGDRHGFLPAKEIAPEYFKKAVEDIHNLPLLEELLDIDQELIVQINKDQRGTKGAALTTFITLAGSYLVLMPNSASAGGISRRIEGEERDQLKRVYRGLKYPKEMGVILRTASVDRELREIQWDLDMQVNLWQAIQGAAIKSRAPFLIHRESQVAMRSIRDYLKDNIEEIIVDDQETYDLIKTHLTLLRPEFIDNLVLYRNRVPLFTRMRVEGQIESIFNREVKLPSGGAIVIDATEALTAIDINSAKATGSSNIEETALNTNLEAAEEIGRQLRLRDIGGLIVIDFIDMLLPNNQNQVEDRLAGVLQYDRAKIQMTHISKFGLVELSRQRIKPSIRETAMISCPRCEGQGSIRPVSSLATSILRSIAKEASNEKTRGVRVQLPIDMCTYLLNERRNEVLAIERAHGVNILLIPNPNYQLPKFHLQREWGDKLDGKSGKTSETTSLDFIEEYDMGEAVAGSNGGSQGAKTSSSKQNVQPAVKASVISQKMLNNANTMHQSDKGVINVASPKKEIEASTGKMSEPEKGKGFLSRILGYLSSSGTTVAPSDSGSASTSKVVKSKDIDQKMKALEKRESRSVSQSSSSSSSSYRARDGGAAVKRDDRHNKSSIDRNRGRSDIKSARSKDSQRTSSSDRHQVSNSRDRARDNTVSSNQGLESAMTIAQNRNNRLNVFPAEKLINIEELKESNPDIVPDILKRSIAVNPATKISPMVSAILKEAEANKSEAAQMVETQSKNTTKKTYIEVELVELYLDKFLAKSKKADVDVSMKNHVDEKVQKEKKEKEVFVKTYDPAINLEEQMMVFMDVVEVVKTDKLESSKKSVNSANRSASSVMDEDVVITIEESVSEQVSEEKTNVKENPKARAAVRPTRRTSTLKKEGSSTAVPRKKTAPKSEKPEAASEKT